MKPLARHRTYSIEFKRRVVEEYLGGDPQHVLNKRHDIARGLIRIWVAKYEAGAYDADAHAADLLQDREVKIAALERLAGRQALEIEFLKGALKNARPPRNASTTVISGPTASASRKDAA